MASKMALPKETKIICTDLDGTLVHSKEAHARALNLAFMKNNLPALPEPKIWPLFGPPSLEVVNKLFPDIPARKAEQAVKDKRGFLLNETYKDAMPIEGVKEAIDELKQKYKLAIVTSSEYDETLVLLRAAGLNPRDFQMILSDDLVEFPKPSPEGINKIKEKLKLKVEYMVGDTTYDIKAGKAAGVKTVAVLSGIHNIKQLGDEEPTMIVKDFPTFADIVLGKL